MWFTSMILVLSFVSLKNAKCAISDNKVVAVIAFVFILQSINGAN